MSVNARLLGKNNELESAMSTTYPDKMLLMLFNGAVKNIENAQRAIKDKDFDRAHVQIIIVQEIISRLMLNLPNECQMSQDLIQTYENLHSKLVDANIKKDIGILTEIRTLMINLQNCWQQEIDNFDTALLTEVPTVVNLTRTG